MARYGEYSILLVLVLVTLSSVEGRNIKKEEGRTFFLLGQKTTTTAPPDNTYSPGVLEPQHDYSHPHPGFPYPYPYPYDPNYAQHGALNRPALYGNNPYPHQFGSFDPYDPYGPNYEPYGPHYEPYGQNFEPYGPSPYDPYDPNYGPFGL